jgi:hypothetical protein
MEFFNILLGAFLQVAAQVIEQVRQVVEVIAAALLA